MKSVGARSVATLLPFLPDSGRIRDRVLGRSTVSIFLSGRFSATGRIGL